jgi:hypothetical protein
MAVDRFEQAEALVRKAREQLAECRAAYDSSLEKQTVGTDLLIDIKHIIDSLRSALDYSARELFERFGTAKGDPNIYFPIPKRGTKAADFPTFVNTKIPGLAAARSDLVNLLASFQEFSSPDNGWLPDLATLSNENKHENLTPQTREETRELRIESQGAGITLGHGAGISLGAGASISFGGAVITGEQNFEPGQAPRVEGDARVTNIIWVSFKFDGIEREVMPFLTTAVDGIEKIVAAIKKAA